MSSPIASGSVSPTQNSKAECLGAEISSINKSLWDMFTAAAEKHPNEEAVCSLWQPSDHLSSRFEFEQVTAVSQTVSVINDDEVETLTPESSSAPLRWTYSQLHHKAETLAVWLSFGYFGPKYIASPILENLDGVKVKISLSNIPDESMNWHSLPEVMSSLPKESSSFVPSEDVSVVPGEELAMILFTSGTTSLPKGCPHTASNIWSATHDYDPVAPKDGRQHKWLIHTPVWHIFAVGQTIRGWRDGRSVIFPADKFDVVASLRALQQENITHIGAVPLLAKALVAHPKFPGKDSISLLYVSMGGTLIKDEDVRFCKENLGSEAVIQGFGMTEGSPMVSWRRSDPLLKNGHHIGVGKVLPELFYLDDVGKWFITGDQALIDGDGILYINGRYKDIIIRGGENLVPSKIEHCLQDLGVIAQVVGIEDTIAGEVPVAVLQTSPKDITKSSMTKAVVERLGPIYAPYSIVTLEDLQLKMFPMTATGKVRKLVLKDIVNKYFATISEAREISPNEQITSQLREIWVELMNTVPEDIPITHSVTEFADSITGLRFCKLLWSRFGQRLYLPDLERNKTIEQQAVLLVERIFHGNSSTKLSDNMSGSERESSLIASSQSSWEASHSEYGGDDLQYQEGLAKSANAVMHKFGLTWENDVEDILTIKDTFQEFAKGQRPQSYRHRIAFKVNNHDPGQVRAALERSLLNRPVLRTVLIIVPGAAAVHAVLRPSRAVYDILITQESFSHESEVQESLVDDFDEGYESRMLRAIIADVGGKSTALIITLNHSVFDALFAYAWYSDLDMFIQNPEAISTPNTPFKLFANVYQQYQDSSLALSDINFHIRRLRGISRFTYALWPSKRAPGWMIGNDKGSKNFVARDSIRNKLNSIPQPRPRLARIQDFPNMERIRSQYSVQASVIVKTAISLFNVIQTGQQYAMFKNFDAGRRWPFLPEWIADRLPSAMSIDGPTLTWTMNMIQIKPKETCGELLTRMSQDQEALSSHAHAPWHKILSGLGEDEGPIVKEAAMRQVFNWDWLLLELWYVEQGTLLLCRILGRDAIRYQRSQWLREQIA
ncbi:long-chain-fatty-acid-CoA ligase [Sclerotinia borealis F-4128]|uniref:Long-chain-fatty-acid-CoA ligase n=1 Tax=Sclerotinia borealis (strain F-4128) TaxID=1432307 RepID=W9C5U8_SCLBF|nr:long-chain-fatty-acid-CoA ligase [Sclerotinia borealis F-4128]